MAQSDLSSFLAGGGPAQGAGLPGRRPSPSLADGPVVEVTDRLALRPDQPLPELNGPTAAAFAAVDVKDSGLELVGHICRPGLPPRLDVLSQLRGLSQPAIVRPVTFAAVEWPPDGAQRLAVILERPAGRRMIASVTQKRSPLSDEQIVRHVVPPLAQALTEFRSRRVFHGALNPTSLYWREADGDAPRVQLGECITAPVGLGQPLAFETIERGMAQPAGRGPGTSADDLYALGASLLFLLYGQFPGGLPEDRALLAAKLEKGSLGALAGEVRLPHTLAEPIRGLLIDDVTGRWTLEDLEHWLNGRRLSPRQAPAARKAARPIVFGGQPHLTARSLAVAIASRPGEAMALIERGELQNWLTRSLDDERSARRVEDAVNPAVTGRGANAEHRRIARLLMVLDPQAPIRYRSRAVAPLGLGGALAEAFARGGPMTELAEIALAQLPLFWINNQLDLKGDPVPLPTSFDHIKTYLERPNPGYGIERALYELNPSLPCASPTLGRHCVLTLDALMRALEDLGGQPDRPAEPIDRHIAAFILSRHGRMNDRLFQAFASGSSPASRALATLEILFELQRHTKVQSLPHLCAWVATGLEPMIEQYHSRSLRDRLRQTIAKQATTGSFQDILAIARNTQLAGRDQSAFQAARRDYQIAVRVIRHRQDETRDGRQLGLVAGRQTAALAGSLLSAVLIVVIILLQAA